ncbi:MAG: beta-ketoacyl-ACP synthase II [Fibrobacterota bacterium]
MMKKVVVTGMGVVSPLGSKVEKFWNAVSAGQSGLAIATKVDPSKFPSKVVGEVKDFNPEDFFERKEARRTDPFVQYTMGAASEAMADAGLNPENVNQERMGVIIGSGIGGLRTMEEQQRLLFEKGPGRVSPFFIPMMISDMSAGMVAIRFKAKGPNYASVSACASASHALGLSWRTILNDEADIMIAGGAEATICETGMAGFCSLKAMSTRNDVPAKASSPFDKKRDGFIMGEGAGIVVLESEEHAKKRGARIYAELCGAGFSCDAFHITAPSDTGDGATRSMREALRLTGFKPEEIDYINAHGTSTELNDKQETQAIKRVFGDHAYTLAVSSTKSMIGHLLGASGGVEFITTVLSIRHGLITPTINYEDPDPDCDLNYTPNVSVKKDIRVAISNSFGFGGHNATVVVRKYA